MWAASRTMKTGAQRKGAGWIIRKREVKRLSDN